MFLRTCSPPSEPNSGSSPTRGSQSARSMQDPMLPTSRSPMPHGKAVTLSSLLARGPANRHVLSRGGCPFCDLQLLLARVPGRAELHARSRCRARGNLAGARAMLLSVRSDGRMSRACSSHVYQVVPTHARSATSSRRSPGVKRRRRDEDTALGGGSRSSSSEGSSSEGSCVAHGALPLLCAPAVANL